MTAELAKLSEGDRLPSTRQIQAACKVSQAVATRALDELQAMNLVEAKPQSGYYKTGRKITQIHIVFLGKNDQAILDPSSFYYENLCRIIIGLSSKGFSVNFHMINSFEELPFYPLQPLKQQRLGRFPQSLIVTFSLKLNLMPQVEFMQSHGFRFLHWLPNFIEPCQDSICIDDKDLMRKQIALLYQKGHRRIAYVHRRNPQQWHRADNMRYEEFCHEVIEKQLQVLPEYLVYFDLYQHSQEECDRQIAKMFDSSKPPTAILVTNDPSCRNVLISLSRLGLNAAVLGTNNGGICSVMIPALSSVGFDIDAGVSYLQSRLNDIENSNPQKAWYLPIVCAERETT